MPPLTDFPSNGVTPLDSNALPEWVHSAAALPLAFAQVREDPRLDLAVARGLPPGAVVVMIASGGDTAVRLGRLGLSHLHAVDINPAQLALSRCKWHLAGHASADQAAALLGHQNMPAGQRAAALAGLLAKLDLPTHALGPLDWVASVGPDHAGRYERAFAALRQLLSPQAEAVRDWLELRDPAEASRRVAPGTELGEALDRSLAQALALPHLVQLFGPEATQNPRRPFAEHFAARTRVASARHPNAENPFLWQMFAGTFPPGHRADWLQPDAGCGHPLPCPVSWHQARMTDFLESLPPSTADLIHLSNILDWLSLTDAAATLASAQRALKPGGLVLIRQLNSTLELDTVRSGLTWELARGAALEAQDRSFFYPRIWLGHRPPFHGAP
jgi:S-adenosylmethionine-diacylglycerol 3-amino-3-carboxypropyl transferase